MPPAVSHDTTIAVGLTVADIIAHNVCLVCHGMKESAAGGTFSSSANYALFNKLTDTIGDHWNGSINMNSDTDYNENTGGCDAAGCHGGGAPHTLPDSGLPVKLGAYGGGGVSHPVGQDWLLPGGHVASANNACVTCHTLAGGGQDPACQDCHIQGNPLTMPDCISCHAEPPNTASTDPLDRPNRQGAHDEHDGLTTSTFNCSACHQGGGTGKLSHYDRVDQTTPNYPADVDLASSLDSKSHGAATYNAGGRTCSGVVCHGGLITPNWLSGSLNVNSQCSNCHQSGGPDNEPNSYFSGEHGEHISEGIACTECHNTTTLASGHFTNPESPGFEQDPADTIGGGSTSIPSGYSGTCNFTCHDKDHENENW
jgi:predicted CxxxxCH...CXXCH cytochrome family protein